MCEYHLIAIHLICPARG